MTMAFVVLASPGVPPWLIAVGFLVGVIVFGPQEIKTPAARRILCGVLIAIALAGIGYATDVVIPDMCKGLTPADWEYWAWGCWLP